MYACTTIKIYVLYTCIIVHVDFGHITLYMMYIVVVALTHFSNFGPHFLYYQTPEHLIILLHDLSSTLQVTFNIDGLDASIEAQNKITNHLTNQ